MKLFTDKAISLKEVRDWFMKNTGMDLTDKEMKDLVAKQDFQDTAKDLMQQRGVDKDRDKDKKDMDKTKQDFGEKLKEKEDKINDLRNKLLLRESSSKYDKMKLTKEILEEIKNL